VAIPSTFAKTDLSNLIASPASAYPPVDAGTAARRFLRRYFVGVAFRPADLVSAVVVGLNLSSIS
jgi:hypothetical protein